MRIRRYAARLLSSTSPGSATTVAPSSPPHPPAASWLHTDDDDCCAFCELSRPAPQEGQDAIKHKGHIAGGVPESDVRADDRVGLPQRPPAPEVKKYKIDHVPPVNKASVGLRVFKRASEVSGAAVKPQGATPVSEAAAGPAVKASAFLVNDAAIEQGVKCIASLPGVASKLEATAENSLVNGSTTDLGISKGVSLANELADMPRVTSIMPEVAGKPVTGPGAITTVVEVSDTGSVVHETTGLESAGADYIASEAAAEPEDAGRASCIVDDTAALDEPRPPSCDPNIGNVQVGNAIDTPSCDPNIGNVQVGNAIDTVASTVQPSQCDAAEGGGSVNFTTNGPVRARGPTIKGEVPKDKSVAPSVLRVLDAVTRSIGKSGRTDVICYARRPGKRKLELLEVKEENIDLEEETLVRSDRCESVLSTAGSIDVKLADIKKDLMDSSAASKVKKMKRERFECNIDYCHMAFKTKAELAVHKKNMCTVNSCNKHFRSHRYLRRHQSAHNDDMPYKCPWDGCNMAFKWSWDRAEHFKVHAGVKPYKCTTPGCSKLFKFVSDFTRHRRRCKPQSFYHSEDVDLTRWEDPVTFMQRVKVVDIVSNPLIGTYDCRPLMLTVEGRKLWRSLVKLVSLNRRRGYCIAQSLVEENLLVPSQYGTFRIKEVEFEDIQGKAIMDFMGFRQVKQLFESLMKKVYGPHVIADLSVDIPHFLDALEVASLHELPAYYHAALLPPAGRALVSIRLASGLRSDFVAIEGRSCRAKVQGIYASLGPIGMGLESMHPFFVEWREHSEEREQEQERQR